MRDVKNQVEALSARLNAMKVKLQGEYEEVAKIREQWFERYKDAIMNERESEFGQDVLYLHGQLHNAELSLDEVNEGLQAAEEYLDEFVTCVDDVVL